MRYTNYKALAREANARETIRKRITVVHTCTRAYAPFMSLLEYIQLEERHEKAIRFFFFLSTDTEEVGEEEVREIRRLREILSVRHESGIDIM